MCSQGHNWGQDVINLILLNSDPAPRNIDISVYLITMPIKKKIYIYIYTRILRPYGSLVQVVALTPPIILAILIISSRYIYINPTYVRQR